MTLKLDKESLVDRVSMPVNFLVRPHSKRPERYALSEGDRSS